VDSQTRRILLQAFYELCDDIAIHGDTRKAYEAAQRLGTRIGQVMLPPAMRERLSQISEGQIIELEASDADVPWELARVGGYFLGTKVIIARTIAGMGARPAATPEHVRACIVGDPLGDLPSAKIEAESIARHLEALQAAISAETSNSLVVDLLIGENANKRRVLFDALLDDDAGASVFHFAGHVSFDASDAVRSSLRLADADLKAFEARSLGGNPFVFINGCRSSGSQSAELPTIGMLLGMAGQFIEGGARVYLGTIWSIDDELGSVFSHAYYQRLVAGGTLGEAFRAGQQAVISRNEESITSLGYVLFGAPQQRLWSSPRILATGPFINEAGIRAIIDLENEYAAAEILIVQDLPWILWSDDDIEAWTKRLPVGPSEQQACADLLRRYRSVFSRAVEEGGRHLRCIVLFGELRSYLDRLNRSSRTALANRIEKTASGGCFQFVLMDSPGLDELEVVSKVTDVTQAVPGEAVYVFNKQTRLEGDSLQYYLYQESDWNLVTEYVRRFNRAYVVALEYTRQLCESRGVDWRADDPSLSVAALIRKWDPDGQ
jgi:CHAT domain